MIRHHCRAWPFAATGDAGHSRSAFTLVELLVVISIIALLIALLLPALASARAAARQAACMSGVRQTHLAAIMYADEHGDYFPSGDQFYAYHALLVDLDYANEDLFATGCPYGPGVYSESSGDPLRAGVIGSGGAVRTSYGLNGILQSGHGKPFGGGPPSSVYHGPQKTSMKRIQNFQDRVVVIACSPTAWRLETPASSVYRPLLHVLGYGISSWEIPDPDALRHETKGLPMSFADGHAAFVTDEIVTGGATTDMLPGAPSWYRNYNDLTVMSISFNMLYDGSPSVLDH